MKYHLTLFSQGMRVMEEVATKDLEKKIPRTLLVYSERIHSAANSFERRTYI